MNNMTKKFLLIGIDGMRPDAMLFCNTPNLKQEILRGVYSLHSTVRTPVSIFSWTTVLTGLEDENHKVTSKKQKSPAPSYLSIMQEHKYSTAAVGRWPDFFPLLEGDAVPFKCDTDDQATRIVVDMMADKECPDSIFIHLDDVDSTGHDFGFDIGCPQYRAAIEATDVRVGQLLDGVRRRVNEDWLVVITTDHGGTSRKFMPESYQSTINRRTKCDHDLGIHGDPLLPQHYMNFVIIVGENIQPGEIIPAPTNCDIAPTVLNFFGLPKPVTDGRAINLNPSHPLHFGPKPCLPVHVCHTCCSSPTDDHSISSVDSQAEQRSVAVGH